MKKTIIAVVISGTAALGLALSSSIAFAQSTTGQLTNDVKQGWDKTKDKASDIKQDIQNKLGDNSSSAPAATSSSSPASTSDTMSATPTSTTTANTNTNTPTEHKYIRKTHYKHHYYNNGYRVHHDINWSADQNMARTGYEAPPRGWNGLGVPRVIPKGDNPKWYYTNYGYTKEEKNDFKWHHHHDHDWKGHTRVYHRDADGNVTYEDQ